MLICWSDLPWQNINTRIINIQAKILKATRSYNKKILHKLQNYLFNSVELRLVCIEYISKQAKSIYTKSLCQNTMSGKQKIVFVKLLFNYYMNPCSNLYFILKKIKQHMAYHCIKNEWKAKIYMYRSNKYSINQQDKYKVNTNDHLTDVWSLYYKHNFIWIIFITHILSSKKTTNFFLFDDCKYIEIDFTEVTHNILQVVSYQIDLIINILQRNLFNMIHNYSCVYYSNYSDIYSLINNRIFTYFRKIGQKFGYIKSFKMYNRGLYQYIYLIIYCTFYYNYKYKIV